MKREKLKNLLINIKSVIDSIESSKKSIFIDHFDFPEKEKEKIQLLIFNAFSKEKEYLGTPNNFSLIDAELARLLVYTDHFHHHDEDDEERIYLSYNIYDKKFKIFLKIVQKNEMVSYLICRDVIQFLSGS